MTEGHNRTFGTCKDGLEIVWVIAKIRSCWQRSSSEDVIEDFGTHPNMGIDARMDTMNRPLGNVVLGKARWRPLFRRGVLTVARILGDLRNPFRAK
jgi:hypothetical protein